jgi:hypothetical protein
VGVAGLGSGKVPVRVSVLVVGGPILGMEVGI